MAVRKNLVAAAEGSYLSSTYASRPAASAANKGALHVATDTGTFSFSTGSTWVEASGPKTFRLPASFATAQDFAPSVTSGYIVGSIFIPPLSGQTTKLAALRHKLVSGAWNFKIQVNGADATGFGTTASPIAASSTSTLLDPADVSLASGDRVDLVAVSGTAPLGPTVTLFLEHTV